MKNKFIMLFKHVDCMCCFFILHYILHIFRNYCCNLLVVFAGTRPANPAVLRSIASLVASLPLAKQHSDCFNQENSQVRNHKVLLKYVNYPLLIINPSAFSTPLTSTEPYIKPSTPSLPALMSLLDRT